MDFEGSSIKKTALTSPHQGSIAVVGGGCAGISAAIHLSDRGYDVSLFERSGRIGGKCESLSLGRHRLNVGATLMTRAATQTMAMMKRAGLGMVKIEKDTLVYSKDRGLIPVSTYVGSRPLADTMPLLRYRHALREFHRAQRCGETADLAEPFHDWCTRRGLCRLEKLFYFVLYPFGYSPLSEMPTWYVMRYIDRHAVNLFFMKGFYDLIGRRIPTFNVDGGYDAIWQTLLAQTPTIHSHLSTPIHRIERSPDEVLLTTDQGTLRFDEVALAISPDRILDILDWTAEEQTLLSAVRCRPYASAVCWVRDAPSALAIFLEDERVPLAVADAVEGQQDSAVTFYLQGDVDRSEVPKLLAEVAPDSWQVGEVLHYSSWNNYFPHFPSEVLQSNPFRTLRRLQRQHRTTFFGGWCDFETVEATVDHVDTTVERCFGPRAVH